MDLKDMMFKFPGTEKQKLTSDDIARQIQMICGEEWLARIELAPASEGHLKISGLSVKFVDGQTFFITVIDSKDLR